MAKTCTFIFTLLTKECLSLRKEKKHEGALHLSGRDLYHLHHVSLALHQHLWAAVSPYMCSNHITSNRLYASTSQIKHPGSFMVIIQHHARRGNFEVDRILMPVEERNYLYFQLRHDCGSSMDTTPSSQRMDLVPFQNKPAIGEYPGLLTFTS